MMLITALILTAFFMFLVVGAIFLVAGFKAYRSTMRRMPMLSELQRMADEDYYRAGWDEQSANARLKKYAFLVHSGI